MHFTYNPLGNKQNTVFKTPTSMDKSTIRLGQLNFGQFY